MSDDGGDGNGNYFQRKKKQFNDWRESRKNCSKSAKECGFESRYGYKGFFLFVIIAYLCLVSFTLIVMFDFIGIDKQNQFKMMIDGISAKAVMIINLVFVFVIGIIGYTTWSSIN